MAKPQTYVGIDHELLGGMTPIGKVIRDAWVFGLIPETETCGGWTAAGIDGLLHKVNDEWDKYGCLVSNLPDDLRKRHSEINGPAIEKAKTLGWDPTPEAHEE